MCRLLACCWSTKTWNIISISMHGNSNFRWMSFRCQHQHWKTLTT
jgi:hypothetical protein